MTGVDGSRLTTELWHRGTERGERIAEFAAEVLGGLDGKRVLDLGCGPGGITGALARKAALAVGVDSEVRPRHPQPSGSEDRSATFLQGNALSLPFPPQTFDLVLMSGLLEWMGFALPQSPPHVAQLQTLREVCRVLRPGGSLFVGIENRWYPKFLVRSPHQGLPFILAFPASSAWRLPRWIFGTKVHERLYGHRALQRLLHKAGFVQTDLYLPIFGYQFPRAIVPAWDRRAVAEAARRTATDHQTPYEQASNGGRWGPWWFRMIARWGVQAQLAPAFFAVGRTPCT